MKSPEDSINAMAADVIAPALHPVQLTNVFVRELFIQTFKPLSADYKVDPEDIHTESLVTEYNPTEKTVQVGMRVYIGDVHEPIDLDNNNPAAARKSPLRMLVHLIGHYVVDESQFPLDLLSTWAQQGGSMTLLPYVREHVFSLTARCGIRPVILPVWQLPTINVSAPLPEGSVQKPERSKKTKR